MTAFEERIVTALLASVPGAFAALGAWLKSRENNRAIQEVHLSMNSRLDEMLQLAKVAAHAQGLSEGIATGTADATRRALELRAEGPVTVVGSPVVVNEPSQAEAPGGEP